MMIPGAWEARRRSGPAVGSGLAGGPGLAINVVKTPSASHGSPGSNDTLPAPDTRPRELPGWVRVSIFGGTLLIAMWLAMTMFF